ncbi:MAG: rhomboid family intramembrane serine protease [Thermoplasmata archaeon]
MLWIVLLVLAVAAASFLYPLLRKSYFTASLVLANLGLFLFLFLLLSFSTDPALVAFVRENLLFKPQDLVEFRPWTLITSMFLHASVLHVVFNILFLYLLGLPLEDRIGGRAFASLYLAAGLAASLLFALVEWGSPVPALGASGAIMGIAGAFLALYPRERIFFILFILILPRVRVFLAVGVVILGEALLLFFGVQDGVAHAAHMGGIGFGIAMASLIRGRKQRAAAPLPALALDDLATTEELRGILSRIQEESVGEVRDAWVDHFLEKARCPQCRGRLHRKGQVVTSDCGWERHV